MNYVIECVEGVDGTDVADDNLDVIVRFDNGDIYTATFFTVQNIQTIMDRYRTSGECLDGLYFWCSNMIIVQDLSKQTIEATVRDLVTSGEFVGAFDGPSHD